MKLRYFKNEHTEDEFIKLRKYVCAASLECMKADWLQARQAP